jgi:uncharacterized membrane protein YbaN (DUF454 family)
MSKENTQQIEHHKKGSKIIRGLWFTAGTICLVLGAIGIVLPILPTTPFLLASAACYYKSSSKMHRWLIHNKWFGEYIRNYQEGKGIPRKTKITALTVLWVTIGVSIVFFLDRLLPTVLVLPMQLTMIIVAIVVTLYMLRLPTYEQK